MKKTGSEEVNMDCRGWEFEQNLTRSDMGIDDEIAKICDFCIRIGYNKGMAKARKVKDYINALKKTAYCNAEGLDGFIWHMEKIVELIEEDKQNTGEVKNAVH